MKITTYQDGNRRVIIFDGLDSPKEDDVIKAFLSSLTKEVEEAPAADLAPMEYTEERVEEPQFVFPDGEYKGQTPADILYAPTGTEKAYKYIVSAIENNVWPEESKKLEDEIATYVKHRFASSDALALSEKLVKGKNTERFFETYRHSLPDPLRGGEENLANAIVWLQTNGRYVKV